MTDNIEISAAGKKLSIHGTVPLYLQWFNGWNADISAIYASAKSLPTSSTIIDVGANIGIMSCSLAVQRPDIQIIAIEPVPPNVECLRRNVAANRLKNVEVVHAAASDKPGFVHVNVNGPWSAVLENGEVRVPAVTLDQFSSRKPAFVKIDVEGWEPYVLAGGREVMSTHQPLCLMEWNTWSLLAARHDPISFSMAVWETFDILDQFHEEKSKGAPTWDRQLVHDNITAYGSVTNVLMRPKAGAIVPRLEEMIYPPAMLKLMR